jgi:hypothetical protein
VHAGRFGCCTVDRYGYRATVKGVCFENMDAMRSFPGAGFFVDADADVVMGAGGLEASVGREEGAASVWNVSKREPESFDAEDTANGFRGARFATVGVGKTPRAEESGSNGGGMRGSGSLSSSSTSSMAGRWGSASSWEAGPSAAFAAGRYGEPGDIGSGATGAVAFADEVARR